ncbi:hypothetical protein GCM10017083_48950 [Thalassobaculum fulvum]|uniref:Uncharacterized protein n=1 Tax=Thalassobaculum fulvum TaxID=1633335 RepID=A0A919CS86_9PROT|nr:hypothetical protein [Thalassobaculum fulvum]GHD61516.1 hypothetical protein GCM10017083_48950 [Thalassobaculum fulvum]
MAIGPTGSSPLVPAPQGQGGPVAPSRLAQGLQEAFGFRSRNASRGSGEAVVAEPLDDAERRQFNLEQAAEEIRRLNPNAPRGSIVDIVA